MAIQKFNDGSMLDTETNVVTNKQGIDIPPINTITSDSLKPAETTNFVAPGDVPVYPVDKLEVAPPMQATPTETQAQDLTTQIQDLNKQLLGESTYTAEQEQAQGLPELIKTQNDLTNQLKSIQAEAQQIPLQMQQDATGRGITAGGLAPLQTARLRANAIQALGTSALLQASQGNIATAQSLVDRAVAQKFDPIREEINATTRNLELIMNSPQYTLEQKNRAQKQLDIQNAKLKETEKQEQDQSTIWNLGIEAAQAGANAVTLKAIKDAKTPEEALDIMTKAGIFTSAEEKNMVLNGFTKLKPSQLAGLTEEEILRMPNGDIWKKPPGEDKVLSISDAKSLGVPYGTTQSEAIAMGITPKSSGGGGGSSTTASGMNKNDAKTIEEGLLQFVGDDGFLNPDDYNIAKKDWIQAGGTASEFDSKFKDRRNPNNPYYDVTLAEGKVRAKNEDDIRAEVQAGKKQSELEEMGYDEDTIKKIIEEEKDKTPSKLDKAIDWLTFWN